MCVLKDVLCPVSPTLAFGGALHMVCSDPWFQQNSIYRHPYKSHLLPFSAVSPQGSNQTQICPWAHSMPRPPTKWVT